MTKKRKSLSTSIAIMRAMEALENYDNSPAYMIDEDTAVKSKSLPEINVIKNRGFVDKIKHNIGKRLYNNLDLRAGFSSADFPTLFDAVVMNNPQILSRNYKYSPEELEIIKLELGDNFNDKLPLKLQQAMFAKYLGLSDDEAGLRISDYIESSPYKPTKSKDNNSRYFRIKPSILNQRYDGRPGGSVHPADVKADKKGRYRGYHLGDYTVSQGDDYNSYYDIYDINPYSGGSPSPFLNVSDNNDFSFGIGHPYELYDRSYKRKGGRRSLEG